MSSSTHWPIWGLCPTNYFPWAVKCAIDCDWRLSGREIVTHWTALWINRCFRGRWFSWPKKRGAQKIFFQSLQIFSYCLSRLARCNLTQIVAKIIYRIPYASQRCQTLSDNATPGSKLTFAFHVINKTDCSFSLPNSIFTKLRGTSHFRSESRPEIPRQFIEAINCVICVFWSLSV